MSNPPLFVAAVLVLVTLVTALAEAVKNDYQDRVASTLVRAILANRRPKRTIAAAINGGVPPKKKRKTYDQNRASLCIQSDYLGPNPTFCDD